LRPWKLAHTYFSADKLVLGIISDMR